jgi:hypothetical protein
MHKIYFLLFSTFISAQNIPLDSVSYDYFYNKEMQTIVLLKKKLINKKFDASKQIALAELYANISCEDSAYAAFYNVYEKEKSNRTLTDEQYKELLFQLHRTESSKKNYKRDRRFFLNELKNNSKKDTSDKWFAKIEYENAKDFFVDSLKYKMALKKIKAIQKTNFFKTNAEFKASVLLGLGNLYTSVNQFDLSEKALNESLLIATKSNLNLHQIYALINLAVNERVSGHYEKALTFVNKTDGIPNKKYRIKIARIVAFQKFLIYNRLNDTLSAKKQERLYNELDILVDDFAKNSNFYEIDVKFQTKEKDAKIDQLNDLENRFVRNKILYGLAIFLIFLLALYSFVRWKIVDRRKRILAIEKEKAEQLTIETKEELETVKKKSIIEHIVLKNKSTVHLDDLYYIHADDHYLELITKTKKETTRGSLKELEDQLPSNFFRCHKSYIVNANFIKTNTTKGIVMQNNDSIPTSKNYKST